MTTGSFANSVPAESAVWAWQGCPAGARATGGGVRTDNPNLLLYESYPVDASGNPLADGQTPAAWKVGVENYSQGAIPFTVYVICAAP